MAGGGESKALVVVCMNHKCPRVDDDDNNQSSSSSSNFKKGWPLRSSSSAAAPHFAPLCLTCGTAYEQQAFCDLFHSEDTGWRECSSCGKRLHCGCIASNALLDLLDNGGVICNSCRRSSIYHTNTSDEKPKEFGTSLETCYGETRSSSAENQMNGGGTDKKGLKHSVTTDDNSQRRSHLSENDDTTTSECQMKQEETLPSSANMGTMSISSFNQVSTGSGPAAKLPKENMSTKDLYSSLFQTNLNIPLDARLRQPNFFPGSVGEENELSSFQQGPWQRPILPKVPRPINSQEYNANTSMNSLVRVPRPPVEGRVKNQLLPRYWPRITEQELQQISGDSNSNIVPLFEKVLSASDAGRIGRLVLPKACAEAYFPPISQPEGLPLTIQDVKGKEWVFQFRFWPNNNSRMYVLEGVTPCIHSMQLQAGDTVTFSRIDPGGKLLMGFRKASAAVLLQSLKGSTNFHLNMLSRNLELPSGDINWHSSDKHGVKDKGGTFHPSMMISERKRSRNVSLKSKRLRINSHDSLELKHTWEELQDMLCPPITVIPSIAKIEDHEFEEYEDPPVLRKASIFTMSISGEQEQWVQCDSCFKWRRLPGDFLLPPKWTCQENIFDQSRCSCAAPDELSSKELENLLQMAKDFQARKITESHGADREQGFVNLDGLAEAKDIKENTSEPESTSIAITTKHPRHRPGCSCIVCIQPPSGKGKHKPTCTCNVCMTVKRRFKTLMLRKKRRQSEHEAQTAEKNQIRLSPKEETEVDSSSSLASASLHPSDNESRILRDLRKGKLDVNIYPHREEDSHITGSTRTSMMSLLKLANMPLETYLKQNGLTSLIPDQHISTGSYALPQATGGSEGLDEDSSHSNIDVDDRGGSEERNEPDQV